MTFTVRVLRRAEGDLFEIYDVIARDSPRRAVTMVERILDRIESLSELPSRGDAPEAWLLQWRNDLEFHLASAPVGAIQRPVEVARFVE
ncbi:MAG: type II toxin-antitoxin system RelE/ParE family toxin [bacterium]|nr:type II toxin-antitoxin system RelE/ParE family toxin [bacterium]